jgi:adenylate cyclase
MSNERAEAARRAASTPEYIEGLVELGILSPQADGTFTTGDVRRIVLVQTLERAGLPLGGIAQAIQEGQLSLDFMDASSYDRFSTVTDTTFAELSETTGVPLELLMVIREAIGFAEPAPDDCVRDIELKIVPLVQIQIAEGFRPGPIERWLRVYGESMRRVAETEADWWHTEVELRLMESGMTPSEMMEHADVKLASRMAPLLDDAILGIYHGHQEHTWTTSIINGVEAALDQAGVFSRLERPPAICFLDLTGYTRLTEERGDEAAADLASRLGRLVRRSSSQHGGKPIKWLGDGVMFFFREPGAGVAAALDMVEGAQAAGLPPAHVGLHSGPVLFQEGDYFGRTVNVAARIADYARPGEVLVSQEVLDSSDRTDVFFKEIGPVELKGVAGPIRLHSASRP